MALQGIQPLAYDPNGALNRLTQLQGLAATQQQISASQTGQANTLFQMARQKDALVSGAVASTLADPGATPQDVKNKLAEVGAISGDPDTQRIAAARAAAVPDDPKDFSKFQKTELGRLQSPDVLSAISRPEPLPNTTDYANNYSGITRDPRTGAISPPQQTTPLQQGPEFRATPQTRTDPATGQQFPIYPPPSAGVPGPVGPRPFTPGPSAAAPSTPSGAVSLPDMANSIIATENGIKGDAAKDPNSTAAGQAAFIDKTWLTEARKAQPQLTTGMTDQQVLALRSDPSQVGLQQSVTVQNMKDNAPELTKAGVPLREDTLAAAHKLGGAGAAAVYSAPAWTPLTDALGKVESANQVAQVISANPALAGMTVGDYTSAVAQGIARVGGPGAGRRPVDLGAPQQAPVTPVAPGAPSVATAPAAGAPMGGITAQGPMAVQNQAAFTSDKQEAVPTLIRQNQDVELARQALKEATTGKGTEGFQALKSTANSYFPGMFTESTSAYDIFAKITAQLMTQAAGPRANELRTELAQVGTPGPNMNKTAAFALLNKMVAQNRQTLGAIESASATPTDYLAQKNKFLSNTDYRAFGLDKYSPEDHTALQKELAADTTGAAMNKFRFSAGKAAPYLGQ